MRDIAKNSATQGVRPFIDRIIKFDTPLAAQQAANILEGIQIDELNVLVPTDKANSKTLNRVASIVDSKWSWVRSDNSFRRLCMVLLVIIVGFILSNATDYFPAREVTLKVKVYDKYIKRPEFSPNIPTLLLDILDKKVPTGIPKFSGNGSQIELETTPQLYERFKLGETAIYRGDLRLDRLFSNPHLEKVAKPQN